MCQCGSDKVLNLIYFLLTAEKMWMYMLSERLLSCYFQVCGEDTSFLGLCVHLIHLLSVVSYVHQILHLQTVTFSCVFVLHGSPHRRTVYRCTSSSLGKRCLGTSESSYTADSSSVQPSVICLRNQYRGSARANEVIMLKVSVWNQKKNCLALKNYSQYMKIWTSDSHRQT